MKLNRKMLLEALFNVHRNGDSIEQFGICAALFPVLQEMYGLSFEECEETCDDMVESIMSNWPKYSGDRNYPIPSTIPAYNASQMFWTASANRYGWDRNTDYGALRWELLEWTMAYLQVNQ